MFPVHTPINTHVQHHKYTPTHSQPRSAPTQTGPMASSSSPLWLSRMEVCWREYRCTRRIHLAAGCRQSTGPVAAPGSQSPQLLVPSGAQSSCGLTLADTPPPHLAPRPLHLLAGKSSLIPASARTPTCTSTLAPGAAPRTRGPPAPGPAPEAGVCIHSGGSRCSHLGQGPFVQSVARQARWPPTVRAPSAHLRLYPFVFPCLFLPKPRWSLPFPTLTSSPKNPIICPVRSQHALPLHPTVSPRPLGSNPPERCSPVTSGDPF